jgi:hypothetical protein
MDCTIWQCNHKWSKHKYDPVLIGNSAGDITVKGVNACGVGSPKKLSLPEPCNNLTSRKQSTSEFNIFPNPTNGTFQLSFNGMEASTANLQIFDLRGNVIKSTLLDYNKGLNVFIFDLGQYNNGMYFVKFILSNQAQTIKVIKQ